MNKKLIGTRSLITLILGVGLISLNTSCALLRHSSPKDMMFVSISLVETKMLSKADKNKVQDYMNRVPLDKALRVEFSSNEGIEKYRSNLVNAHGWTVACSDWKDLHKMIETPDGGYVPAGPLGMEISSVYRDNEDVFDTPLHKKNEHNELGPFTYHFYIAISKNFSAVLEENYDLNVKVEDLCFQITSADMLGLGAKTNIITIPKAAVVAALKGEKLQ